MKPGDVVEFTDQEKRIRLARIVKVGWKWVHVQMPGYNNRKKLLRENVLKVLPSERRRTR